MEKKAPQKAPETERGKTKRESGYSGYRRTAIKVIGKTYCN